MSPAPSDYRWLTSEDANPAFQVAASHRDNTVQAVQTLRRSFSLAQTHLILEQVELRPKALAKFAAAEQMFFERVLLEQATDELVASYKASRFPAGEPVLDLCCGLGGDTIAFCQRGPCTAVDQAEIALILAEANLKAHALSATCRQAEAGPDFLRQHRYWHIDPDRRARGRKVTHHELLSPSADTITAWLRDSPHAAIKLAPATPLPPEWSHGSREWISSRGEVRQQLVWFGDLASTAPDRHTATKVSHSDLVSFEGPPHLPIEEEPGGPLAYVYELDRTILAARLTGAVAAELALRQYSVSEALLTSDEHVQHPFVRSFEVIEVLPYDNKQLRRTLRQKGIGQLEIKLRGIPATPDEVRRRLKLEGDRAATLLISQGQERTRAVLARRI